MPVNSAKNQTGFTLIELIIGIVIFAIALTFITSLIFPQARKSVDPIMQVRATELANTLIREITAKAYDENSQNNTRCNDDLNDDGDFDDAGESACTAIGNFGPDSSELRNYPNSNFDDVDDYHGLQQGAGYSDAIIRNSLGEILLVNGQNLYAGFSVSVLVTYDGDMDGIADNDQSSKLILVNVTTPSGETLQFSTYRSNY
ncbi:prepilin-type N-terminal cleavage/methylation domain-containing protein [Aliiglaciecola sp. NS0011-25]|uniref:type IV pilus modification PilV family protein n=1 Tax=Aliiglaciecola sp. NS0011-25 TaxID=3127654 RepID=UPI00310BBB80